MERISDKSLYNNSNSQWYQVEGFFVGNFQELYSIQQESIRLIYVDSGQIDVCFTTPSKENFSIHLRKFDFLLIDYNVKMTSFHIVKDPTILTQISIKKACNEAFNIAKHISVNPDFVKVLITKKPVIQIKRTNSFNKIIKLLEFENSTIGSKETSAYMQNLLLSMLFIEISREFHLETESVGSVYVKKACDYIHKNYEDDIKLDDIANMLFIHPSYLRKLFKEQFNETFIGYLTNVRIERAKELLSNSSLPMVEISESIGVKNREHFQRIFTKIVGVTPGNYRKLKTLDIDSYKSPKGTHKRSLSI